MFVHAKSDPKERANWFPFPLHLKPRKNVKSKYVRPDKRTQKETPTWGFIYQKNKLMVKVRRNLNFQYFTGEILVTTVEDDSVLKVVAEKENSISVHLRGQLEPFIFWAENAKEAQNIYKELVLFTRP